MEQKKYFQPEIECASQEKMRAWQNERLKNTVRSVYDSVPYYRELMKEKNLTPDDIGGLDDLCRLPFLSKDDLREAYPYGLLARPLSDCVRIQSTSGTTGKRVVAFYTQHDLDVWEECCARAIVAAGGGKDDVVHVCYGYGLFTGGPGVSFECSEQTGMHINEDHFIAEIINPDTGEVLPEGSIGELVFTSITKEAFPLIRYRTRDICHLTRKPCSCGRTHVKMCKPMGRSDDMLIVKGVNVFPSQIETVLINRGYPANYQIVVDRVKNSDTLEVQVEMTNEMFSDNLGAVASRERELVDALKSMLGIYANVKLVNPKTITRSEGKAQRVIDKRKLH